MALRQKHAMIGMLNCMFQQALGEHWTLRLPFLHDTPSFRTKSTYLKYILYKNARCKDVQQFCSFDIFRSVSRNTKWASIYFNASPNMSINYEQILIRGNTSMTAPCLDPHLEIDCRVG